MSDEQLAFLDDFIKLKLEKDKMEIEGCSYKLDAFYMNDLRNAVEDLLNMYKSEKDNYDKLVAHFIKNHISKDQIRAVIDEYKIKLETVDNGWSSEYEFLIEKLSQLLEERGVNNGGVEYSRQDV